MHSFEEEIFALFLKRLLRTIELWHSLVIECVLKIFLSDLKAIFKVNIHGVSYNQPC